jgi:GTP-binding protein HflX
LDELLAAMADQLAGRSERVELVLPLERSDLLSALHRQGQVLSTAYEEDGVHVHAVVPLKALAALAVYRRELTPDRSEADALSPAIAALARG